jgi:glycosyltransferase involved in cell wall biosynthesis
MSGRDLNLLFVTFEDSRFEAPEVDLECLGELRLRGHRITCLVRAGSKVARLALEMDFKPRTVGLERADLESSVPRRDFDRQGRDLLRRLSPDAVLFRGCQGLDWFTRLCWEQDIPVIALIEDAEAFLRLLSAGPSFAESISAAFTGDDVSARRLRAAMNNPVTVLGPALRNVSTACTSSVNQRLERLLPGSLIVGIQGPVLPGTGHVTFLEAARIVLEEHADCLFVIMADELTGEFEAIRKMVDSDRLLRENVCWMNLGESHGTLLDAFDIGVVDPDGNTADCLIEAGAWMEAAIAPVAGASQPMRRLVRDGVDGLLFEPRNSRELAGRLLRLARDPSLSMQLGRSARIRLNYTRSASSLADQLEIILPVIISPPVSGQDLNGRHASSAGKGV